MPLNNIFETIQKIAGEKESSSQHEDPSKAATDENSMSDLEQDGNTLKKSGDEENLDETYLATFRKRRGSESSTNKILIMDSSTKSFYDMEYMKEHIGDSREYWRDVVLGVNDGLVSTFLLVAGVYGSGMDSRSILMTAISGTIAGAISMAGGEYVATKTQEEIMKAEHTIEKSAIKEHKHDELRHLSDLLTSVAGIPEAKTPEDKTFGVREAILSYCEENDDAHNKLVGALAFGSVESSERNPFIAGVVAFCLFTLGSMTSLLPFIFTDNSSVAFIASFIATMVTILLVGAVKTWATKANWVTSAIENFVITSGGGGIAYLIGMAFEGLVKE